MRRSGICTSDQICLGHQTEEKEMASACGACDNEKQCIQAFSGENLSERHCLEDQGINGRKDIYA